MFSLWKRLSGGGYVTAMFRYLKDGHIKEGVNLFSVTLIGRTRANVLKLKKTQI